MDGMMESSAVTLVVKTPNRSIDDLQISCALNWTVEKLKRHLSSVYPSKPESKKQRLIYSGQLLLDHQTVKDFLREHQDGKLHTLHLVCPPSNGESSPSTSAEPSSSSPSTTSATSSPPLSPSVTQSTSEGLRYRGHDTPPFLPMFSPSPPMWPTNGQSRFHAPMFPPPPPPQMTYQLWMQQMQQMQQMYQQQMAAVRGQQPNFIYMPPNMQMPPMPQWPHPNHFGTMPSTTPPSPQHPTPPQTPQTPPQPAQPPEPANVPQREPANVPQRQPAQPRNQEVRMNAQGGIADDDDDEENQNNDWLDKIYTLCRAAILLSIVWFYSSTGRFLMLIISVFFIYLYQLGFFDWIVQRNQQQRENNPAPPQEDPQQQEQIDETDNTEEEGESSSEEETNVPEESEEREQPQQPPPPPAGPSTFRVAISFIYTFFTSLVPQQNEVFQGN